MAKQINQFQTIRSEGALLPPDVLQGIAAQKVDGTGPASYHLPPGTKLSEAIAHSWGVLQKYWKAFQEIRERLPDDDTGTEVTNQHWLLPLFEELKYGRLTRSKAPEIDGRTYPIERFWAEVPIHLIGCNLPLDRRTKGARGAATAAPHSMMQEFLNRREESLWGFMSNGLVLRMLRDNVSLSRQAYVEFDLEAMMDGEVYADFALLWMLCHQSRVEADKPQDFWLEKWSQLAREQGTRVLSDLRAGVAKAIETLGRGFIGHPRNDYLREQLQSGALDRQEYYRQLLRIVYRLLFLFVAEDRGLLHGPDADPAACELYDTHYSTRRLRELADQIRGSKHADLWHSLSLVFDALGRPEGCPELGLPALGSFLWRRSSTEALSGPAAKGAEPVENPVLIRNDDLLAAVRALAYVEQDKVRRTVDYRNLGSEELGSVYESLLELHPRMSIPSRTFELSIAAGHERKTTGSYYTPDSLVQCLLDSALEPVVDDRLQEARRLATGKWETDEEKRKALNIVVGKLPLPAGERAEMSGGDQPADADLTLVAEAQAAYETAATSHWNKTPFPIRYSLLAEQALLALKVCDPAAGSGHFLIAAAHRLARHLARVRTDESEPSPDDYQHALRDVIGHCIYGVDINPMAVELCKVSLWMEALEPGKPLSFLEHHVQCGNSLLGTTPALLKGGIPDDAFKPIEGDDKSVVRQLKKDNKQERKDYERGYRDFHVPYSLGNLPAEFTRLTAEGDETVGDVADKERRYVELVKGTGYQNARLLADMWCAAFVWRKEKTDLGRQCPTERFFRRVEASPHSLTPDVRAEIERLASQYQFFHWHLAFPDIFQLPEEGGKAENSLTGWNGGFDVVLANPPWERVKLQEKEWFATRQPEIAAAPNAAARKRLIKQLADSDPELLREFHEAVRQAEGVSHLLRDSGSYPLCGRGDVNVYTVFAELFRTRLASRGRFGAVLPSGIATDDTTKFYFQEIVESRSLVSFYDFENKNIFPEVHSSYKFCLITAGSGLEALAREAEFAFFCHAVDDLREPGKRFTLSAEEIELLNPNTRTCPIFRTTADAELTKWIYRRVPVLIREARDGHPEENPWGIKFATMFHMSNDSHLFRTREQLEAEGFVLEGNVFRKYEGVGSSESGSGGEQRMANGERRMVEEYLPLYEAKMIHQFEHRHADCASVSVVRANRMEPIVSSQLSNASRYAIPRYWVPGHDVLSKANHWNWQFEWFIAYRRITRATDFRTITMSVIPLVGSGDPSPIVMLGNASDTAMFFLACVNSVACDFTARGKISGIHLDFHPLRQVAMPSLEAQRYIVDFNSLVVSRVLELTYTAWDLEAFALDCGYDGPPFRWDEERRFLLRCELDAAYFHLYLGSPSEWGRDANSELPAANSEWRIANGEEGKGKHHSPFATHHSPLLEMFPTPRDAVDYIMETFPIVKRKDIARTQIKNASGEVTQEGRYITKDTILEIYDEMAQAIETGQPYQTRLDPPPGPPTDADGNFIPMAEWDQSAWPPHIHPPKEHLK